MSELCGRGWAGESWGVYDEEHSRDAFPAAITRMCANPRAHALCPCARPEQLEEELRRKPTDEEVCERLGVKTKKLKKMRNAFATATLVSLDAPLLNTNSHKPPEGGDLRLVENVQAKLPSPLDVALFNGLRSELTDSMRDALTPPERDVIRMRLGVDGGPVMTRAQVGTRFNLSTSDVLKIERTALSKLRSRVDEGWLAIDRDLEAAFQRYGVVDFIC